MTTTAPTAVFLFNIKEYNNFVDEYHVIYDSLKNLSIFYGTIQEIFFGILLLNDSVASDIDFKNIFCIGVLFVL
jgi:hypothetical protein